MHALIREAQESRQKLNLPVLSPAVRFCYSLVSVPFIIALRIRVTTVTPSAMHFFVYFVSNNPYTALVRKT